MNKTITNPGAGLTAKLAEKFKDKNAAGKQAARAAVAKKDAERKEREAAPTGFFNVGKHKCWI